jgi:hypothetical protein
MLPSVFKSIADDLRTHLHALVVDDTACVLVPDLLTAEEAVLTFTRDLGRSLIQEFVDVRVKQALDARVPCVCGRQLEILQHRKWTHETLLGPVSVPDPYTYCRVCHDSERPVYAWLGTGREDWSLPVQEAAVDLAADESCGKAVAKLARHHPGVEMGRATALRMLHRHGAEARAFIEEKLDAAAARSTAGAASEPPAAELEAEYDAGMIPVATMEPIPVAPGGMPKLTPVRHIPVRRRAARWEEVKVSLVQKPGTDERLYAMRPTGGIDEAFGDLLGLACLLGWAPTTQVRGIADGALYIRPRMEKAFASGEFRFILDRPHCKEHLHDAGVEMAPSTGIPADQWAKEALKKLEGGCAAEVVDELQRAYIASGSEAASRNDELRLAAGYFRRNTDAVSYAEYRERGWGTASSEVESGHRHTVQVRMKIAGAWWHPDGVDDILALRMLKANGWWDEYWLKQRQQWRKRADELRTRRPAA